MKNKKNIILLILLILFLISFMYRGYIAKYNTHIYISNESDRKIEKFYFILKVDNELVFQDTLSGAQEWRLGKFHSMRLTPGFHKVTIYDNKDNLIGHKKIFTLFSVKLFVIFKDEDFFENKKNKFSIYKEFGRKFVIE